MLGRERKERKEFVTILTDFRGGFRPLHTKLLSEHTNCFDRIVTACGVTNIGDQFLRRPMLTLR
jgi:hypothetical protein